MAKASAGWKRGKDGLTAVELLVQFGPTLLVDVGHKSQGLVGEPPNLPAKNVKALIDTGAGGDCIDDRLAKRLNLPVIDEGQISGVGGVHHASIYLARLYVPQLNRFLFQRFAGVRLSEGGQYHEIILGRRFLQPYVMTYDGRTAEVVLDDGQ